MHLPAETTLERRASIASHEAAHAVVHHFLQRETDCLEPIREVTLRPSGKYVGAVRFDHEIERPPKGAEIRRFRGRLEDLITVLYAGPEMDRLNGLDRPLGRGDLRIISALMGYFPGKEEAERRAFLEWLQLRARALLSRPDIRCCITAVAASLLERETLSEELLTTTILVAEGAFLWGGE